MNKTIVWLTTSLILLFVTTFAFGQEISEEARRHSDYGKAAVRAADYETAISEFLTATRLTPGWPDAFFNLGLSQEAAKKYKEAAASYREYLRLAPNAGDAEKVKGLINKMDYLAMPVPPIAKGFLDIPWGATPEQIGEAMAGQGYHLKRKTNVGETTYSYEFYSDLAGVPFRLYLWTKKGAFCEATSYAMVRSPYPQVAQSTFNQLKEELSGQYGSPQSDEARMSHGDPFEMMEWTIVDSRTTDTYEIKLEFTVCWFTNTGTTKQYIVNLHLKAGSLSDRLEKK